MNFKSLIAAASVALGLATGAQAITVTNVGGSIYQIDFDPITFVATRESSTGFGFIVDGFFATDATQLGVATSGTFKAIIDGTEFTNSGVGLTRGTFSGPLNDFDPSDLLVGVGNFPRFEVNVGSVVTISAENLQFSASGVLPLFSTGPFNSFLVDGGGNKLSAAVEIGAENDLSAVPLPAGAVLLLSGLAGFAALRRRKAAGTA